MECSCINDFQDLSLFVSDLVICSMYCKDNKQKNFQMHDPSDSLYRKDAHPAHFGVSMKLIFMGHTSYAQQLVNQELTIPHLCQQVKNDKLPQPSQINHYTQDQVSQEYHC